MRYIGIDPGLSGALAVIDDQGKPWVMDVPTFTITTQGRKTKTHQMYDMRNLSTALIEIRNGGACHAGLEKIHAMPKQGVNSMFSMGVGFGMWEAFLCALGMTYELITPQAWKKKLMEGMGKEKSASVIKAKQLFPTLELTRKKIVGKGEISFDGRADAILIAEYLRRNHQGG